MTKNKPVENPTETPADIIESEKTLRDALEGMDRERLDDALARIEDVETTLKCMLDTILALETKFGMRFMPRGEFYGVEFKAKK